MALIQVVSGVYQVTLGFVNVFLIDCDGLTLIDTGISTSAGKILRAVAELGRKPADIRHILITHLHQDHVGSLKELKTVSGAETWMHTADAALLSAGSTIRQVQPGPGLLNWLVLRAMSTRPQDNKTEPFEVDHRLNGGETIPAAGGIRAIHVPGHTAGSLAFLWEQQGGVCFLGDSSANFVRLTYSFIYENLEQGRASLKMLGGLSFNTACFSHGKTIQPNAAAQILARFSSD
ncbi:MAG TPA: MBL fold metallo-hydrolase [Anaerolineaceae bacterium]